MAIYPGSSTFNKQGDTFEIQSPTGDFNNMNGLRITNYTVDILVLVNINGDTQSTEYLMPFCQMVYPLRNIQDYPKMYGKQLGADIPSEQILIEWSTDAENDFLGTYPFAVPLIPYTPISSTDAISATTTTIIATEQTEIVDDPDAANRTIVALPSNTGPVYITATADADIPGDAFTLVPGAGITINNGGSIFVTADSSDETITVISDRA